MELGECREIEGNTGRTNLDDVELEPVISRSSR